MSTPMEVDPPTTTITKASSSNKDKPRFEVKKVASKQVGMTRLTFVVECRRFVGVGFFPSYVQILIRGVDIVVDNCAICRNHIMDLCTELMGCFLIVRHRVSSESGKRNE